MRLKGRLVSFLLAGTLLFSGIAMPVTAEAAPLPAKQKAEQPVKPKAEKKEKETEKPVKPGKDKPGKVKAEKPAKVKAEKPVKIGPKEFSVDFAVGSESGDENSGVLILKNLTDRTIYHWRLSFQYDREIVSVENAIMVSCKKRNYTLLYTEENAEIEPYGTVEIRFEVGLGDGKEKAEHFKLHGNVSGVKEGSAAKPEHKPGEGPGVKPECKPGEGPGVKPENKPGEGPAVKPECKPGEGPVTKPEHKPGEHPEVKPGHKPGECPTVKPEEPTVKPEEPEVFLNVLSGTVTDAVSGNAVTGSVLKVLKDGEVVGTSVTDESGVYSFELYDGSYTLLVETEHYYVQEIPFVSEADATAPEVKLNPVVYTLTGVVKDKTDGEKLSEICVTVRDENGSVAETITDENGAYTVELYHKTYELEFSGTDYEAATITVVGGDVSAADVELERSVLYEIGYLYDYQTLERVEGVTVTVMVGDTVVSTDITDEEGNYKVAFFPGEYTILYEKAGYEVRTTERSQYRDLYAPGVPLHPEIYKVYGSVKNAMNGQAVTGAAIKVYAGTFGTLGEIPAEELTVATGCSKEDGSFDFMLPKGEYTLIFEKENYISSILKAESVKQGEEKVAALSPVLRDNEFRIVLTWGSTPKDLDSYLKIYEDDTLKTQLYHGRKTITENGKVVATLDMDDKDGCGPETVTVTVLTSPNRRYAYSVKCYSSIPEGGVTFAQSGATVTVYCGEELVKIYTVPDTQEEKIWDVFDVVEGQIIDR